VRQTNLSAGTGPEGAVHDSNQQHFRNRGKHIETQEGIRGMNILRLQRKIMITTISFSD